MTCQACGRVLEPGTSFCPACGTPVGSTCASCGMALPAKARFCPACGAPTGVGALEPTAEPARERKMATMLFADLVGSTALSEAHDPEIVSRLVGGTFERLAQEVRRYEGTIEKFAGDAMLAVFGVPTIHEDDPERAVRAALEMQAAIGVAAGETREGDLRPHVRIGIETGEVLVDLDRASGARDLFVTGDAVNTAARLQTLAEPGTVVVGAKTYAATRELVDYEELPPVTLKGKAELVVAWRAVTVKARRGGLRIPLGIEAPLVGRQDELGLVKETVRRAATTGRPQLVTVIGAAGVGKSRLTWELEKYLDGLPEAYHWRKGRCLSYAQASYSALADAIKADIGAADDDTPATVITALDARLTELDPGHDPEVRVALIATLGLDPEPLARDRLVDGWTKYLGLIAAVAPLVLVMEDIHWADDGLLDFIEYLARWGEGPIAILCLDSSRAPRPASDLGRRDPECGDHRPRAAQRCRDGRAGRRPARRRPAGRASRARGRPGRGQPALRRGAHPDVRRPRRPAAGGRRLGAGAAGRGGRGPIVDPGGPGRPARRAARRREAPGPERGRRRPDLLGSSWSPISAGSGPGPTGDLLRRLRVKELVVPRQPSSLAGAAEFGFRHVLVRDVAYDSLPEARSCGAPRRGRGLGRGDAGRPHR